MAVGWWLSGLFILGGGDTFTEGGLGYFSMNLLAFVTPLGWSRFLPAVPVAGPGQEGEGFLYLGAGVLALVVLAVGLAVAARRRHRPTAPRIWPPLVVAAAVVMAIFALSPVVTFGSRVILDLNGPWAAPLATFRSSGRFAWPLAYVLVIWTVVTVARRLPDRAALAALGLALRRPVGRSPRRTPVPPPGGARSGSSTPGRSCLRRRAGGRLPRTTVMSSWCRRRSAGSRRSHTNPRSGWRPSTP